MSRLFASYHNAAIRGIFANHDSTVLSLRAVCRLYFVCIYINASAGTSNAASNNNAVLVVNGRRPLSISFRAEYDMFTCFANERCGILRAS